MLLVISLNGQQIDEVIRRHVGPDSRSSGGAGYRREESWWVVVAGLNIQSCHRGRNSLLRLPGMK